MGVMTARASFRVFGRKLTISIAAFLSLAPGAGAQKVVTVAGGYVGDGKPATSAALEFPQFAAFDLQGNLLITEACRIRKVDKQGLISTIAGTGVCGFSGDGGSATRAKLASPTGIAVDSAGDIFFADYGNQRVRKIDPAGTITTIAGNGKGKYCGDGGQAVNACLNLPQQLTIGNNGKSDVLYIADLLNQRIRQVVLRTGIITTVAGNGTAGYTGDGGPAKKASLSYPYGVAVYDKTRTLWISDTDNTAIRQVDLKTGIITTFINGSFCYPVTFCQPQGLTTDASGNLLVVGPGDGQVLSISVPGQVVTLEAGGFGNGFNGDGIPADMALLDDPTDVVLDSTGYVLIVDAENDRIRKGSGSQKITTVAGGYIGDGKPATSAAFNFPANLAFDPGGNLYVTDTYDNRIRKITPSGTISTFAGNGIIGYSGDGGPARKASLAFPDGVATDSKGNVFISDSSNSAIRKVDKSGTITTLGTLPSYGIPQSEATDSAGNLYVADSTNCVIWKFAPDGTRSIVAGVQTYCGFNADEIPATQAFLDIPLGVALDAAGNLYIGDAVNNRVRMVDTSGIIHRVAGNGEGCGFGGDGGPATSAMICFPAGVAVDVKGNLYFVDGYNDRIRVVNSAGTIETLAGTGNPFYNGNGLPALKTNMCPYSVAVSPTGGVYLTDACSYRVRKVQ
jgi:sugar lactone lactonase YvrE